VPIIPTSDKKCRYAYISVDAGQTLIGMKGHRFSGAIGQGLAGGNQVAAAVGHLKSL